MHIIDQLTIARFHEDRTRDSGTGTTAALGWSSAEAQQQRFDILCGIADMNDCTVLDAGCGHGDLFPYLLGRYPTAQYMGLDYLSALLDVAVERHGQHPQAKFLLGNFANAALPATDYVLCCGALNYKSQKPDYIAQTIARLFAACRRGFAFNLLSAVQHPESILVAHHPETILNICRQLTPQVQWRNDYCAGDFTVYMYR